MSRPRARILGIVVLFLLLCGGMYAWSERADAEASGATTKSTGGPHDRTTPVPSSRRTTPRPSLRDACEAFVESAGEPEAVNALMRFALFSPSLGQMVARCRFSEADVDALLGELNERVIEGDREAARLAYALAGASCEESPHHIDNHCDEQALEESLSLADWRSCVQDGYERYHDCVAQRLGDAGLNPTTVRNRYIYGRSVELSSLIDETRLSVNNDAAEDLDEVLTQLESVASDRVFVEGVVRPDVYSTKLFSLSFVLGKQGDTQAQERVNRLLLFWGHRSEMIVSIQEEPNLPYNENLATLSP